MKRRTFIANLLAGLALFPAIAEGHVAPSYPVPMSWVNQNILAVAAPGTVLQGWQFIGDEPLIIPSGITWVTVRDCTFESTADLDRSNGVIQLYGANCSVYQCDFDCAPGLADGPLVYRAVCGGNDTSVFGCRFSDSLL